MGDMNEDEKNRTAIETTGYVVEPHDADVPDERPLPTVIDKDPRACKCRGFVVDRSHPAWAYYPYGRDGEPTGHHPDCPLYELPERPVEQTSEDLFDTLGELAIQHGKRAEHRPKEAGIKQTAHDVETGMRILWDLFTG